MNRYMDKAVLGFGVVLVGASLLSACNTTQDSGGYVEKSSTSRAGQNQAVVENETSAPEAESKMSAAHKQAAERHSVEESFHAPSA